jgi:hypothetical protein
MSGTPRLALPFLSPGQAQKELLHNEALQLLDIIVAAAVEEGPRTAPPNSPAQGACYIVASGATGEWAGKDQSLAAFTNSGWRYVAATEGMSVFVSSTATWGLFRSGAWELGTLRGSSLIIGGQEVVGARAAAIAAPTGGSTVDTEARVAIGEILTALRGHGLIEM